VEGFCSVLPRARVVHAASWFRDDAIVQARELMSTNPAGVFACNDRLGQAVLEAAVEAGCPTPVLMGFDDAPVAERLHLSTIAIPWTALAREATQLAIRRITGDRSTASHVVLAPRPVMRLT
jgi:DNA-binding LacI/PurR family transcriptional regulator